MAFEKFFVNLSKLKESAMHILDAMYEDVKGTLVLNRHIVHGDTTAFNQDRVTKAKEYLKDEKAKYLILKILMGYFGPKNEKINMPKIVQDIVYTFYENHPSSKGICAADLIEEIRKITEEEIQQQLEFLHGEGLLYLNEHQQYELV